MIVVISKQVSYNKSRNDETVRMIISDNNMDTNISLLLFLFTSRAPLQILWADFIFQQALYLQRTFLFLSVCGIEQENAQNVRRVCDIEQNICTTK